MNEFPDSWAVMAISDAVINITITDKKIPQKEYLNEGAYPVFDQGQDYIGGYTDKKEKLVDCELPVLVFGDHTRVVKFVKQPFAAGADGIKVLQPQLFYNSKLLEYFTLHIATHLTNHGYARHYQHLVKSLIPLPPANEQTRIVAKIEELFSELDKGVESLKTAQAQLKVYRQALLKHAFEGKLTAQWRAENQTKLETADTLLKRIQQERTARYQQQFADWQANGGSKPKATKVLPPLTKGELAELPELPGGWDYTRVGAVIDDPAYGTSKKCDYEVDGVGVLRIPNVISGRVDASDLKFAQFTTDEIATYKLNVGDILIIRSNGSVSIVGRCALVSGADVDYLYAGYLIRLRPHLGIVIPQYLLNTFSLHAVRKQIEHKAKSTSGVNNINTGEIQSLVVALCGIEEQKQIQMEIEARLSEVDQLDQTLISSLQQAETLRQSILKRAFSGQLVPQDPHDEPASALLARIRAEREQSVSSKRGRKTA